MEAIKKLVASPAYDALLARMKSSGFQINNDVPTALYAYEATRLKAADADADTLLRVISEDEGLIAEYALLKEHQMAGGAEDQEYPAGEEPEPDDSDEIVATLPHYRSFMVGNIIEYHLLKERPGRIGSYLKSLRTPQARKYEKQIAGVYERVGKAR